MTRPTYSPAATTLLLWMRQHRWTVATVISAGLLAGIAWAGAFVFSGESFGVDIIVHPQGYTGSQNVLTVEVCIDPNTTPPSGIDLEDHVETPIKNNIAVWNQLQPTVGNSVRGSANNIPSGSIWDFESVGLHEVGHCIGLAHVNTAQLSGSDSNYTNSTDGANDTFDTGIGPDNVRGTSDDVRGDDVNLHWFRVDSNDPGQLPLPSVIDSTTYARATSSLPAGHSFAANLDRTAAGVMGHPSTFPIETEAVMQQVTWNDEDQRRLTADDVATILLAASGLDRTAGTSDDYVLNLTYGGISDASSCDINVRFDTSTGFASCSFGGSFITSTHLRQTSGTIRFNPNINWFFNQTGPCRQSISLTAGDWKQMALSCDPGSANTVQDVLQDDLSGTYGTDWILFERDALGDTYNALGLTDPLTVGRGYWIKTLQTGQTIQVEGQFNTDADFPLQSDPAGRSNLVGHRYWYGVDWSAVRVIDGANVLTLSQADPGGACQGPNPIANGCVMSRIAQRWTGSSYAPFDGITPGLEGTLQNLDGFWVKAFKDNISLRIVDQKATPAAPHGSTSVGPTLQFEAQAQVGVRQRKKETDNSVSGDGWYIRLTAESDGLKDSANVLGQLPDSLPGKDSHDLIELPPFGDEFLSIVFPQRYWGEDSGDYSSDFHQLRRLPFGRDSWMFEVLMPEPGRVVTLRWEGPAEQLGQSSLIDLDNRDKIRIGEGDSYTFLSTSTRHRFVWQLKKAR